MAKPVSVFPNLEGRGTYPPESYVRGDIVQIGGMPNGTAGGKASVAFIAELDPNWLRAAAAGGVPTHVVFAETTLRNFMVAAVALAAAYPDECRDALLSIDALLQAGPRGAG